MTITRSILVSWISFCILFFLYGCAPIQPDTGKVESMVEETTANTVPPATSERRYFTHTIRWQGEKIVTISEWYTGSEKNWLKIIEANPTVDPKQIKIGDSILIPEDLMKTQKPMPQTYRGSSVQPKKKSLEPPPPASTVSPPPEYEPPGIDEIDLFGPIFEDGDEPLPEEPGLTLPLETIE